MVAGWIRPLVLAAVLQAAVGCRDVPGSEDPSPHRVRAIPASERIELEVLDWGGSGPFLVLLAGLGNTAHVFDDFAPMFTARARVVGITRRGFGASTRPQRGYELDTLVHDIRSVLDTLGIDRCFLIGHSFAGDEITRLAGQSPERVRGIVYLDAAHDRTGLKWLAASAPYPPPPVMTASDSASVDGWSEYMERYRGVRFPRGELLASLASSDSSRFDAPDEGRVLASILNEVRAPDYARVRAPMLAVFAVPEGPADMFPYWEEMNESDRRRAQRVWDVFSPWEREQIARFRREVPSASVQVIQGGNHLIFLSHADTVARMVSRFLNEAGDR